MRNNRERTLSEDNDSLASSSQATKSNCCWGFTKYIVVPAAMTAIGWMVKTVKPSVGAALQSWNKQSYQLGGNTVQTYACTWATGVSNWLLGKCEKNNDPEVNSKFFSYVVQPAIPLLINTTVAYFAPGYPAAGSTYETLIGLGISFGASMLSQVPAVRRFGFFCCGGKKEDSHVHDNYHAIDSSNSHPLTYNRSKSAYNV